MTIADKKIKSKSSHPLDKKLSTVEEAAKAKTDYLMNHVLKGYDLYRFKK